ncbi:MAG: plastocyanin/azurin family copper-binding protein [Rhodothermales bacterium]
MSYKTIVLAAIAACGVLALFTSAADPSLPEAAVDADLGSAPDAVVGMTNTLKFEPDTVEVTSGETVEWRNTSLFVHTVTADPDEATLEESVRLPDGAEAFDSGTIEPEGVFRHTFTTPGVYRYFCIPHEGVRMYGTVIVGD